MLQACSGSVQYLTRANHQYEYRSSARLWEGFPARRRRRRILDMPGVLLWLRQLTHPTSTHRCLQRPDLQFQNCVVATGSSAQTNGGPDASPGPPLTPLPPRRCRFLCTAADVCAQLSTPSTVPNVEAQLQNLIYDCTCIEGVGYVVQVSVWWRS